MSTPPYMELITEVLNVVRRDFYQNDAALLNPNNANPVIDGEWLELNSSYKLIRGSGASVKPAWQVWTEKGRYDTQAIGKSTLLFLGGYEAETSVYTSTGIAAGDPLVVNDVTVGGLTRRGLLKLPASSGTYGVRAYCTRVLTGKIRYIVPCAGQPNVQAVA